MSGAQAPGTPRRLGVALVGHSFMGQVHSHAWHTAPRVFELPLEIDRAVLLGRDAARTAQAARRLGWRESSTSLDEVLSRDDVDLIDICTPGASHAGIAVAALAAGKHVLVEKPMANSVAEAEAMTAAAEAAAGAGAVAMVGFTYRRLPAVALARQLVAEGRIGEVRHVRAQYLQDWLLDPEFPLTWRLRKEIAGSGALGDLGAHAVDLLQHVTGEALTGVSALQTTFVHERPLPTSSSGLTATGSAERGTVTVDDAALLTARLTGGGLALVEATRFATGRKNALRLEIDGSRGALAFDVERLNELELYDATVPGREAGWRRILVTEADHPWVGAWWPPGHVLGWEHAFTHQVHDLVGAVAAGVAPEPSFADGLGVQRVLDAVERSASREARWTKVGTDRSTAGGAAR